MKTLSKILAALLALSLLFAAGCAKNEPANTADPASPTASPAGTADSASADDSDPAAAQAQTLGLDPDEAVVKINGQPVTAREFLYWANATYTSWGVTDADWDLDVDGITVEELLKENVISSVKLYRTVEVKCAELGVTLPEADEE